MDNELEMRGISAIGLVRLGQRAIGEGSGKVLCDGVFLYMYMILYILNRL